MTDDPRVQQLLDELIDSQATPEEVCASYPELLPQLRRCWHRMQRVEADLDALFPPVMERGLPPASETDGPVPRIAGYEVDAVLGRGGVGVVYQARHLRLARPVALKMLLAGPYARPEEVERFLREAQAVAALRHPNIVQVYEAGEVDGRPYFTMELVEGGSLKAKVEGTPQPAAWAASLTATLAGAIHFAHENGFVHRDLKPANVLLTADGTPKVTDFGLVRRLEGEESLTLSGVLLGTPSYMAPEQARGDKSAIGPATDVYALGAILYELLTGRPPFRADTPTATLYQVVREEPVPPTRLNSRVPRDLETICLKCLRKGPAERYAGAAALADDLRRFERHEPIAARPPGTLERAVKWVRRRPAAAALVAAAVLMLAGITAAAVWYAGDRAQRHAEALGRANLANAALDDAEVHLKDLRERLDDPLKVRELLSDINQWGAIVGQAREALQRAKASVGEEAMVAEETRDRIQAVEAAMDREQTAYELARKLDDIAVEALASISPGYPKQREAMARYEHLFAQHGLDSHQLGTDWFESANRSSPIRYALIAALDHWALIAAISHDPPQVARLLELLRAADPDPWRDRLRDPAVWAGQNGLTSLIDDVDIAHQPPTVLASLGWLLLFSKEANSTAFFERALLYHPRDFWLHLHALHFGTDPGTKVGLALATLALRPQTPVAYCCLSWHLRQRGDLAEALVAANRAIDINPNFTAGYIDRGLVLQDKKDLPGAVAAFQKAIELEPDYMWPIWCLGDAFRLQGDRAAAAAAYRKAADLQGATLRNLKDLPRVIASYQRAIQRDPGEYRARLCLAQIFHHQGRYAEAAQAYLESFKAQPACVPACDALARLLATCPNDKVRDGKRAVEYATTACERTEWKDPLCVDTLAAAYAEAGRFDEAVRYQTRALDDPKLKGDLRTAAEKRLELYRQKKAFREERH
jgi:serine/threonine-protein kinase